MGVQIIEDFIESYQREQFYFNSLAKKCADICKQILEREGIKAVVTFRSKDVSSLRDKLMRRNKDKQYSTEEEIRSDIIDLAGVRISLLYYNDLNDVDLMLSKELEITERINFPKDNAQKSKYIARHLRVKLLNNATSGMEETRDIIEVQISSVLLNAWADIEHDIKYKPRAMVSPELTSQLDQLHALILQSELWVNGIYKGYRQRATLPRRVYKSEKLENIPNGSLIRGDKDDYYYWYAIDDRRYVFPNEETLHTWFPDGMPKIYKISDQELKKIPLGGNITYRPGSKLIKIDSDPSIYAISRNGTLRKLMSGKVAYSLFGGNWMDLIDTIPDEYFVNYSIGQIIDENTRDYNPRVEAGSANILNDIGVFPPHK